MELNLLLVYEIFLTYTNKYKELDTLNVKSNSGSFYSLIDYEYSSNKPHIGCIIWALSEGF